MLSALLKAKKGYKKSVRNITFCPSRLLRPWNCLVELNGQAETSRDDMNKPKAPDFRMPVGSEQIISA